MSVTNSTPTANARTATDPSDLFSLLEWGDHPYTPADPWEFRRTLVRRSLVRFRACLDPVLDRPRLRRIETLLGPEELERILQTTGVAEVLLGFRRGSEARVFDVLEREVALARPCHEAERVDARDDDCVLWSEDQIHCRVRGRTVRTSIDLPGGLQLVDDSPLLRQGLSGDRILSGRFVPFTAPEFERVADRIQSALTRISEVSSPTRDYVFRCTNTLFVRKFGALDQSHSNSRTSRVGWIFLGNPHLPECSVGRIVEMLLHEALHHDLALREYQQPFMAEECPSAERVLESPWTGARIIERNLSHAILVWFSLACFFERFGDHPELLEYGRERLPFYRAGFLRTSLTTQFHCPEYVHPGYLRLLERIEAKAQSWR